VEVGRLWAKLGIDASEYERGLKKAESKGRSFVGGLSGYMKKALKGAAVAVGASIVAMGGMAVKTGIQAAASFEQYKNILTTTLGTQEKANKAFKWILDFARSTPFEVPGLVEAFTRLSAYGIEGQKVLRTLGDTAAAMGKDIMQAVEALADAQTGEFERLKEFGIKALEITKSNYKQLGVEADKVGKTALMYTDKHGKQRVAVVDRNNREIVTSTLMSIWNDRYKGAMERQSKTLVGIWSNFKDNITNITALLAEKGLLGPLKKGLSKVVDLMTRFQDALRKGGLKAAFKAILPKGLGAVGGKELNALKAAAIKFFNVVKANLPKLKTSWDNIVAAAKNLWPVLLQIARGFLDIWSAVVPYIPPIINFLTGVVKWLTKHKVILGILAATLMVVTGNWAMLITAVIVGVAAMWPKIKKFFQNLFNKAKSTVDSVVGFFKRLPVQAKTFFAKLPYWFGYFIGLVLKKAIATVRSIISFFRTLPSRVANFFYSLGVRARNHLQKLISFTRSVPGKIVSFFSKLPAKIRTYFHSARQKAVNRLQSILEYARTMPTKIYGIMRNVGRKAWEGLKSWFNKIARGWRDAMRGKGSPTFSEAFEKELSHLKKIIAKEALPLTFSKNIRMSLENMTLPEIKSGLSREITINVPLYLDGREVARATASYLDEELSISYKKALQGRGLLR
jgi:hypothetical protein